MTVKRKVSNPLALAVLCTLSERPMHPYQVSLLLKQRRKHESIRLNYGSLYSVVDALEREELIVPHEIEREGKRPERTVYTLTAAGETELYSWLHELISTPVKEYPQFVAGLSLLARLPKDVATELFAQRRQHIVERLDVEREQLRATMSGEYGFAVPRLFVIEIEYEIAQLEAERVWLEGIESEIRSGAFPWPQHRFENGRDIITMPDGSERLIPLP